MNIKTLDESTLDRVLEEARWAPSGDNTQPWRFERIAQDRIRIHAHDTREWCVYDLEGRASQIAVGALLETISLAAGALGFEASFTVDGQAPDTHPIIDVVLHPSAAEADPLYKAIRERSTQRRRFSSAPLSAPHKAALESAVGASYRVVWIEGAWRKLQMTRMLLRNAHIRLTIREAYEVHKRIIEWDAKFSEDRIPDQALGLSPATVKSMRWAMASWERVKLLNTWLGGTLLPRLEMDLIPGLGCAAHFLLVAEQPPKGLSDYLAAGRAVQRLWLACTAHGIRFQPAQTPIIFSDYSCRGIRFASDERALAEAEQVRHALVALAGEANVSNAVFAGRVGYGSPPSARSLRLPLAKLAAS